MVQELIPEIEKRFRVAANRENRAVAGLSMGGYGALLWTLSHPELFSRCYAISAAAWDDDKRSGGAGNNIFKLLANFPDSYRKNTRFFLDCGDDDVLLHGNLELYELMKQDGVSAELRVRDGMHNWHYFSSALPEMFEFLAE